MVGVGKVYTEQHLDLKDGDRLYFYSDGIIEAMNPEREQFGIERLLKKLDTSRTLTLHDSLDQLTDELEHWTAGQGYGDDVSLLALEIKP
jgi:serine phosphatase RsbU (regulator of sigma subunit)